ncbi:MAG TPA: DUF3105 domain-containing protein [Gaiellaceae bacterium]
MAKKSKTPRPPRPVQAPKRRVDTRKRSGGVPPWAWIAGAGVVVVIVVVVAVSMSGGGSGTSDAQVAATMRAAGCTFKSTPPKPAKKDPLNYHADVPSLSTPTKGLWSTFPPSGGAHYGLWAVWGFYRDPVNPRQVVHNEEHGAVVLWWGPQVPPATVDKLEAFYQQQPDGVFGTPLESLNGKSLGDKIALTAWTGDTSKYYQLVNGKRYYGIGHVAICSKFSQKAFAAFRKAYRGKGPEGIPLADDEPGMGPQS